ncbi:uroporphyrinogen-III synthase [Isoptericola sp. b490]|uniref:uroporphyrinogen-III synthase n=1 Tax=Actinotalea lenta TaxID=3064654 RepID=UPI0027143FD2|nr:uroporphyrinogen-III synthase [Isoptericola sp. b490]MDO8122053.1 uroporphyrinogen-III synthase [Isoptericola sp. b490]
MLVPRAGEWAERVSALLEEEGARALVVPLIEFAPPDDPAPLDAALDRVGAGEVDWVALTSATTVSVLEQRCAVRGTSLATALAHARVAAVGPATAAAAQHAGVHPDLIAPQHSGAGLVAAMPDGPGTVLAPHSDLADTTLVDGLRGRGWTVRDVVAYRTVAGPPAPQGVRRDLADGAVDAVLLTSPSTVAQLLALVGTPPPTCTVVCIGDRTRRAAAEAGLTVHVTPPTSGIPAMVEALAAHAAGRSDAMRPSRSDHQPPGNQLPANQPPTDRDQETR